MNEPSSRQRKRNEQAVRLLCLALGLLSACGDELSVGKDTTGCAGSPAPHGCDDAIELSSNYVGVSASGAYLTPVWTALAPVAGEYTARAKDGGLWLFGEASDGMVFQHLSPSGELGPRALLAPPADLVVDVQAPAVMIDAVSSDSRGPLLMLSWSQLGSAGCLGLTKRDKASCFVNEVVALNEGDPASSLRVVRSSPRCLNTQAAYRSADGASFTLIGKVGGLCQLSSSGELSWSRELPNNSLILASTVMEDDEWVFASFAQTSVPEIPDSFSATTLGLSVLNDGGAYDRRMLDAANVRVVPIVSLLAGTTLGQYTMILPRFSPIGASGDLSVTRFQGRDLVSEQVLIREGYVDLSLESATTDAAGSVYLATHTGMRAPADQTRPDATVQSSLLCKFPAVESPACFELTAPNLQGLLVADTRRLEATTANVVYSIKTLSNEIPGGDFAYRIERFDVP